MKSLSDDSYQPGTSRAVEPRAAKKAAKKEAKAEKKAAKPNKDFSDKRNGNPIPTAKSESL